jgi:hypothetical protein
MKPVASTLIARWHKDPLSLDVWLSQVKEGAVKVLASEEKPDAYLDAPGVVGVYACSGVTPKESVIVTCYNRNK